jgi:predicted AAA+ superfamily ATPase
VDIIRQSIQVVQEKLKLAPAVAILGSRQVGKTTIALQLANALNKPFLYLDLESSRDLAKFGEDAESFFEYHHDKLIILDEVQTQPQLFPILRSVIDRKRSKGRFLLLGSATPELIKGASESLAGRVSYFDLNPLNLKEVTPAFTLQQHWYRGGYPLALLAETDKGYMDWVQSFIRSYVQSDLSMLFGYALNPAISQKLMMMLAHNHGQLLNAQDLSRSVGVTSPVVTRYIDFLAGAFLVYKLQPWFPNVSKRLVKSPKTYIKDSGLLHGLLFIESFSQLTLHPIIGASWEGYVVEQVMYHKPAQLSCYFYRTHSGAEADLVLVKGNTPIACIEIKYSNAPKPTKGFFSSIGDLGTKKNFIITPATDTYFHQGATVCSLKTFVDEFLSEL